MTSSICTVVAVFVIYDDKNDTDDVRQILVHDVVDSTILMRLIQEM